MLNSLSLTEERDELEAPAANPLNVFRVALAVFLGMWAFSISVAIVYLLFMLFSVLFLAHHP